MVASKDHPRLGKCGYVFWGLPGPFLDRPSIKRNKKNSIKKLAKFLFVTVADFHC
jgi:hypothetical protein